MLLLCQASIVPLVGPDAKPICTGPSWMPQCACGIDRDCARRQQAARARGPGPTALGLITSQCVAPGKRSGHPRFSSCPGTRHRPDVKRRTGRDAFDYTPWSGGRVWWEIRDHRRALGVEPQLSNIEVPAWVGIAPVRSSRSGSRASRRPMSRDAHAPRWIARGFRKCSARDAIPSRAKCWIAGGPRQGGPAGPGRP